MKCVDAQTTHIPEHGDKGKHKANIDPVRTVDISVIRTQHDKLDGVISKEEIDCHCCNQVICKVFLFE